jgi:hypothetical protein
MCSFSDHGLELYWIARIWHPRHALICGDKPACGCTQCMFGWHGWLALPIFTLIRDANLTSVKAFIEFIFILPSFSKCTSFSITFFRSCFLELYTLYGGLVQDVVDSLIFFDKKFRITGPWKIQELKNYWFWVFEKKIRIIESPVLVISKAARIARLHERIAGFLGSYLTFSKYIENYYYYIS